MRRRRGRERGATAILVALLLVVLGGFLALSLNVGHMMSVRGQLQNAADAGALAGAMDLDGTPAGLEAARAQAQEYVARHMSDLIALEVDLNLDNDPAGDIVLGHWDAESWTWSDVTAPFAEPRAVNAIRVQPGRYAARGTAVEVFFSVFLGPATVDETAAAVAVRGGTCADCAAPFVFADCLVRNPDGSLNCGRVLTFTSAISDNFGFTNLTVGESAVNPPTIIDILRGDCAAAGVGDEVGVSNGNNLTGSVIAAIEDYMGRNGPTMTAPIVAVSTCPDPQFNRLQPISGFATFTVLEVTGAPNRSMTIELACDEEDHERNPGGCAYYGTSAPPRLVR